VNEPDRALLELLDINNSNTHIQMMVEVQLSKLRKAHKLLGNRRFLASFPNCDIETEKKAYKMMQEVESLTKHVKKIVMLFEKTAELYEPATVNAIAESDHSVSTKLEVIRNAEDYI